MPKIYDSKSDNIETLIYMAKNKCIVAFHLNKYNKCELCDDIPEDKIYKCIKCRQVLCKECMIEHLIKTNELYQCEICSDIFDDKKELEIPHFTNFQCKECVEKKTIESKLD